MYLKTERVECTNARGKAHRTYSWILLAPKGKFTRQLSSKVHQPNSKAGTAAHKGNPRLKYLYEGSLLM